MKMIYTSKNHNKIVNVKNLLHQINQAIDLLNKELQKKVRGHTKKNDIWNLERHERILVTFDETWQPVVVEGNELTRFLGTLVRMPQHIGIDYPDWRKVPQGKKIEDLWSIVKEKFSFDPAETEEIKKWVMSDMASKWKAWKYELKKSSYDPSLTINEIVTSQTDDRVNKDQFKVETEKKKKNRLESKDPHVTGTKSFTRLTYEETQKNDGIQPSRGTIYCMSRTRKDGSVVNAEAAEVVEKLKTVMDSSSSNTQGVYDWTNDDLSKVKGHENRGRVRCVG